MRNARINERAGEDADEFLKLGRIVDGVLEVGVPNACGEPGNSLLEDGNFALVKLGEKLVGNCRNVDCLVRENDV